MQSLSTNLPLVRLSSVNPFLLELSRRQLDGGAILRKMGLPGQVPASSDLFASALTIYEFLEEAAITADDPLFGFTIGQSTEPAQWDPIAISIDEAETVGDLLRRFVVRALDHSSSTEFFVRTEGERTTFGFSRKVTPTFRPAQNDAFYVGLFGKLLRQATGDNWDSTKVLAKVSDAGAIPAGADMPKVVSGDNCGIKLSFPTYWQFDELKKSAFTKETAESIATHFPESLVESVRSALSSHLHEPGLTVERAASICGYPKRRLAAKLRKQGTTIIKELAALRAETASDKIANTSERIAAIGESVGFKDPTVFSRAFKNWTGQSPQEYRRNNRI